MSNQDSLEKLQRENQRLRAKLEKLEEKQQYKNKLIKKSSSAFAGFLVRAGLGKNLEKHARIGLSSWLDWKPGHALPKNETVNLVAAYLHARLRIGFFVILASVFGLIPSMFLLQQTLLMSSQTRLMTIQTSSLESQNRFMAFEQTSRFRTLMKTKSEKNDSELYWPPPDRGVYDQICFLGKQEPEIITRSIMPLALDENRQVSSTALLILDKMYGNTRVNSNEQEMLKNLSMFYLQYAKFNKVNLSEFSLRGHYPGIDLSDAYLRKVSFSGASLKKAKFNRSILRESNLSGADLSGADLSRADLSGSILIGADLSGSNLRDADLSRADLKFAKGWRSILSLEKTRIKGVINAQAGFIEFAISNGALH